VSKENDQSFNLKRGSSKGSVPIVGAQALVFGTVVGIFLGIIAAIYRNSFWDHVTTVIAVLGSDYILLARAKGLSKTTVIWKHAIRNALIPIITIMGPMALGLLTGGTVVERLFGVPGLGDMMVNAINTNDYFVILAESTIFSAFFVFTILIVDLLYGVIALEEYA